MGGLTFILKNKTKSSDQTTGMRGDIVTLAGVNKKKPQHRYLEMQQDNKCIFIAITAEMMQP